jgi:two-component system cell cycle response regulator CtrA
MSRVDRAAHALARRPGNVITKENILDLLYAGMPDQPDMKIIDVFICKARAKLTPLGIELTTVWGRGYMMDAANRLKLTELVERAGLAPAEAA